MELIAVDAQIPTKPEECPYSEYWEMTSRYKCKLLSGLYSRCDLDRGAKCEQLKNPIKLKPCPFCGDETPVIKTKELPDGYCHYKVKYVACESCGARTMERTCDGYYGGYCSDEEIAAMWNQRANIPKVSNSCEAMYMED